MDSRFGEQQQGIIRGLGEMASLSQHSSLTPWPILTRDEVDRIEQVSDARKLRLQQDVNTPFSLPGKEARVTDALFTNIDDVTRTLHDYFENLFKIKKAAEAKVQLLGKSVQNTFSDAIGLNSRIKKQSGKTRTPRKQFYPGYESQETVKGLFNHTNRPGKKEIEQMRSDVLSENERATGNLSNIGGSSKKKRRHSKRRHTKRRAYKTIKKFTP